MSQPPMRRAALALAACAGAALAAAQTPPDTRRSGFDFMSPDTQAMQRDDAANPGMLWVRQGEALWSKPEGAAGKACADCHGDARQSMRGVAARYPAYSETLKRPIDLQGQINHCRAERQGAAALPPESPGLLALTVFAAHQSRGMPVADFDDSRLQASIRNGKSLYEQRIGQLNFSCGNCHTDNAGKRLAGNAIPEAHPTGYPVYRLEWQSLGSLQRRLRNCMTGVRAEAFPYGSGELIDLELYLMQRARGMAVETPAVRP